MWQNRINIILGVWLVISGIIMPISSVANMVIVGAVIFILGLLSLRYFDGMISLVIGFWLFFSGLLISLATPANFIVSGLIILLFSLWAVSSKEEHILTY